jgi:hypothetical protein
MINGWSGFAGRDSNEMQSGSLRHLIPPNDGGGFALLVAKLLGNPVLVP